MSRASQEDLEDPVPPALKVNQVCRWPRKVYQDPEDRTVNQDCPALQAPQERPGRTVSLVYPEPRVNQDSQASDSQDPQELKDSQVFPASQEPPEDQADQVLMDSPASLDSQDQRVSLALASLAPQVYQEYLDLKVSLDQREILVSQEVPVHLDDLDLMAVRGLKVSPVYLVHLDSVAHLDPPSLAHWGHQAHLDSLVQWDNQDSLDQMERRETPAPQV